MRSLTTRGNQLTADISEPCTEGVHKQAHFLRKLSKVLEREKIQSLILLISDSFIFLLHDRVQHPPGTPPPCQAKDSLRHWLKSICCLKSFKIATQSASSLQPWQKHERSPQNLSLFPFPQNSFAIQTNKSSKECLEHLKEPNFLNRLHLAGNSQ